MSDKQTQERIRRATVTGDWGDWRAAAVALQRSGRNELNRLRAALAAEGGEA